MALTQKQLDAMRAKVQDIPVTSSTATDKFSEMRSVANGTKTSTEEDEKPKASFLSKLASGINKTADFLYKDAPIGILQGAAKTVINTGERGARGIDKLFGINKDAKIEAGSTKTKLADAGVNLEPTNAGQKVGYVLEQIGEYFIPNTAIMKARGVVSAATKAAKISPALKTATNFLGRSAIEGAANASVAAAQGGSKKDVTYTGLVSAALPAFATTLSSIISKVPDTAWSSILKRTPAVAEKNPLLAQQAAGTGIVGWTRKSIMEKAKQGIQAVEVTLDDLLSKSDKTIDGGVVAGYLDELSSAYSAIPGESASVDIIQSIANEVRGKGTLPVKAANELKRTIYDIVAKTYGKGLMEVPVKREAQKIIAAGLKKEIEKVVPETIPENAKQAIYIQMRKAIQKTIARGEGKGIAGTGIGLYDLLVGGIVSVGAGATGSSPFLGLGILGGKKALESPIVLSSVAKMTEYFNTLSPTKKLMFYNALRALTGETTSEATKASEN